ncbi:U11/U12 small nuclear ribonucleoprotein 25 kDa protein-like isoform X2 [Malus domestica]|uniref:U11/U12 small nuclear ribonucleoprotein 25 kDa protein-like isoform X2 n=1 Tax=Malus domestica TaxID=3750 RepID=UPI003976A673
MPPHAACFRHHYLHGDFSAAAVGRTMLTESCPRSRLSFLSSNWMALALAEIQVSMTATVAELKEAVKDVFSQSPMHEMISWSHVWGNFCLCYKGQKLLDYKALIRLFGIKDGDKIFFVQHASIKYEREKRRIGLWRKRICDIPAYEQLVKL